MRKTKAILRTKGLTAALLTLLALPLLAQTQEPEPIVSPGDSGRRGGTLRASLRTEPRTFNPVTATDNSSRTVINLMMADLVHINRESHRTEPSLARSCDVSPDGRRYTVELRRGIRFSDGHPLDADDVLFTFQVFLDENLHPASRDLLIIGGEPIEVQKLGPHTVVFELAETYGPGERLFDSFPILPRHVLEKPYREGNLGRCWTLSTPPEQIVGLGPFRLKEVVPGERLVVERNPHYWKVDREGVRLPYLDEIAFGIASGEQTEFLRFQAGETDVIDRISPANFALARTADGGMGRELRDLGPGLEYNFLFFNLNDLEGKELPEVARKQSWFRNVDFRRAVSAAIDRQAVVRLVYNGLATPIGTHVTPGNKLWVNETVRPPEYSLSTARRYLREGGFHWNDEGMLVDSLGQEVRFSVLTTAGNTERAAMATIIQEDLQKLEMSVHVVTLDFRAAIDRIFQTYEYEACLLALGSGDVDPNSEWTVWHSSGATHLWHLGQTEPSTEWEEEMDRLMEQQMTSSSESERKRLYDRVQRIVADQLPIIAIASPNILVGADGRLGNFRPAILLHYTLWNAEELFFRSRGPGRR